MMFYYCIVGVEEEITAVAGLRVGVDLLNSGVKLLQGRRNKNSIIES